MKDRAFQGLVQYVFGSGNHGQTLIARDEHGEPRESRVSYYPADRSWGLTIDHPKSPPDAIGYLGRPVSPDSLRVCLDCHTTTAAAILDPSPSRPPDRGIACERCHGPGGNHIRAVTLKFPDLAIARPRRRLGRAGDESLRSATGPLGAALPDGPGSIRFQGPTFVRSRCYTESGSLSCVTCHNPHRDAGHKAEEYEAICLQCHPSPGTRTEQGGPEPRPGKTWAACPVNPRGDCLKCHMPRVPDAVPRAVFTDHHIRVREESRGARPSSGDAPSSR